VLADRSLCVILNAVGTGAATTGMTTGEALQSKAQWRGAAVSTASFVAAVVVGEAAIMGLTGASRSVAGGANVVAWLLATVLTAVFSYCLAGLPQIRAWEKGTARGIDEGDGLSDPRVRLAVRSLSGGGKAAYVVASVVGGPIAMGWYYGRRRDPRARSLTWTSAWVFGLVWTAVYLGLLAWIF